MFAVLPLIAIAMILAVQNLMNTEKDGGKLARLTILWYVGTTILAIIISTILVDLVWRPLMTVDHGATLTMTEEEAEDVADRGGMAAHDVNVQVFESFVPNNVAAALANDELLAVLVSAIVVGCLIKGPDSSLLRAFKEIERIVMNIITFLIKLAPIGVFYLILSNLFTLDIGDIGQNLGVLVGGSIVNMAIHLFIVLVSQSYLPPDFCILTCLANPVLRPDEGELLHLLVQVFSFLDHCVGDRIFSCHNASNSPSRRRTWRPQHRCPIHHSTGYACQHGWHGHLLSDRRRLPGRNSRNAT
jgi:Na+/H+-dicarboxylate symporter